MCNHKIPIKEIFTDEYEHFGILIKSYSMKGVFLSVFPPVRLFFERIIIQPNYNDSLH